MYIYADPKRPLLIGLRASWLHKYMGCVYHHGTYRLGWTTTRIPGWFRSARLPVCKSGQAEAACLSYNKVVCIPNCSLLASSLSAVVVWRHNMCNINMPWAFGKLASFLILNRNWLFSPFFLSFILWAIVMVAWFYAPASIIAAVTATVALM